MQHFNWDKEKNLKLKEHRGISFEEIVSGLRFLSSPLKNLLIKISVLPGVSLPVVLGCGVSAKGISPVFLEGTAARVGCALTSSAAVSAA